MDKQELERRTKQFAIRVIRFVGGFDRSTSGQVIGRQLLKSGTSIGANYREANRAVSRKEFVHKITIAEKEASETVYWLEICNETSLGDRAACGELIDEANELLAIFTSIGRSVRANDRERSASGEPRVSSSSTDYASDGIDFEFESLLSHTMEVETDQ
jgi:four helix bundle protein